MRTVRIIFGLVLALFSFLAIEASQSTAHAQTSRSTDDKPLLITLLEKKYGFVFIRKRSSSAGTAYILGRKNLAGDQTLQVAFDRNSAPQIFRIIHQMAGDNTVNAVGWTTTAVELAPVARPSWREFETPIRNAINALMDEYAGKQQNVTSQLTIEPGVTATLRVQHVAQVAAIDFPVNRPYQMKPSRDELFARTNDTTFLIANTEGQRFQAYHAPNGRYVRLNEETEEVVTGSWQIPEAGKYCVEEAPTPGWACKTVFFEDRHLIVVEEELGELTGMPTDFMATTLGNARNLPLLRVEDVLDAERVRKILLRRSEFHREADEFRIDRAFFAGTGAYAGRYPDGETAIGRWAILKDGRRCMQQAFPEELDWECVFLRETDGGTFAFINELGQVVGEAVYKNGNPENL